MISSSQHNLKYPQQVLPILSINKFVYCLGIHRKKIEKLADEAASYYIPFQKKTGTKERTIDNPRGFILCPGCEFPPLAEPIKPMAFIDAARQFGVYK